MAKLEVLKGKTSKLIEVFVADSSSTTGAGLTGLVFNSAGLTAYYYRSGAASAVAITLVTMTLGTWVSGGFIVIDGTNLPGWYQLGLPNLALASGADHVAVHLKGATNMAPLPLELRLVSYDPDDAVALGLSRLDAAITSRLAPTTAGRTLDVSALGEADADVKLWLASAPNALIAGRVDGAVGAMATGVITASAHAAGAIDAAAIATDAIGSAEFSQAAADKVWASTTRTLSAFAFAVDLSAAAVQAVWDALTTALTTGGSIGKRLADFVDAAVSGRATQASVDAVQADTDNLQTRLPAALVGGRLDASVGAIDGSGPAAQNQARAALAVYRGSVTGASTPTTLVDSGLTQPDVDHWKGRIVLFTTGALALQGTDITAFTPATDTLTVTALTQAPLVGDQFVIV